MHKITFIDKETQHVFDLHVDMGQYFDILEVAKGTGSIPENLLPGYEIGDMNIDITITVKRKP